MFRLNKLISNKFVPRRKVVSRWFVMRICATTIVVMLIAVSIAISQSSHLPEVEIKYPTMNSSVPGSIEVDGSIIPNEIPLGWHMWVFVNPFSAPGQWWPQGGGEITPWNNTWYTQAQIGGGDADVDKVFKIVVAFVDERDNSYLNKWVIETNKMKKWPSIPMPASVNSTEGDSVIVKRLNPKISI